MSRRELSKEELAHLEVEKIQIIFKDENPKALGSKSFTR
jgi:hypothetical protein